MQSLIDADLFQQSGLRLGRRRPASSGASPCARAVAAAASSAAEVTSAVASLPNASRLSSFPSPSLLRAPAPPVVRRALRHRNRSRPPEVSPYAGRVGADARILDGASRVPAVHAGRSTSWLPRSARARCPLSRPPSRTPQAFSSPPSRNLRRLAGSWSSRRGAGGCWPAGSASGDSCGSFVLGLRLESAEHEPHQRGGHQRRRPSGPPANAQHRADVDVRCPRARRPGCASRRRCSDAARQRSAISGRHARTPP